MPDTTTLYYYNGQALPFDSLPGTMQDSVLRNADLYRLEKPEDQPDISPYVLLAFAAFAWWAVRKAWKAKGTVLLGGGSDSRRRLLEAEERRKQLLSDYSVYEGRDLRIPDEQIEKILSKHSPYYRRLAPDLRVKFLNRTRKFLASKTFLIKSNEPFVEMPVLLSATAVQLSFGLDDYLLPHYQYIRIYPEAYFAKGTLRVLAGHVYGNTITVAWNHFLDGFAEYADGTNVGLHEMAHALYMQEIHLDPYRCNRFEDCFNQVMAEGQEVYEMKHRDPSLLFSENAYKDLQEFWAESVELFFEKSSELKRENPELYQAVATLLQQDPASSMYPV